MAQVAVLVINHNHGYLLPRCLNSVRSQCFRDFELTVYDNGSTDGSLESLRETGATTRAVPLGANLGYAAAANIGVRESAAPFVLILNPDVVLTETFLERLLTVADIEPSAGSFAGKLLRLTVSQLTSPQASISPPAGSHPSGRHAQVIDSTGHLLLRNRWALNRGEGEIDRGQYDEPTEVFGVCGAAALYRRAMLEDVKVGEHYFAETFFAYLEDVDLDWRARLRGWKAYYVPTAVAYHERGHKGRPYMRDPFVLRHSLKNRYLMMLRNDRLEDVVKDLPAIVGMELFRFLDYLLTQPRALRGYADVLGLIPHVLAERRQIQRRRTAPAEELRRWFRAYPVTRKLREKVWDRIGARAETRAPGHRVRLPGRRLGP